MLAILRRHVLHIPGRQELALLDVDRGRPVSPAAISKSVWRHRNAGICNTSTGCRHRPAVISGKCTSVSTGNIEFLARTAANISRPRDMPDAARGAHAGAVRLVITAFINQPDRRSRAASSRTSAPATSNACASRSLSGKARRSARTADRCRSLQRPNHHACAAQTRRACRTDGSNETGEQADAARTACDFNSG